ncbi:hypothetical protein FSP39_007832 [Pinctada imbricata]|uniref:Transmembrane protein 26 n=1 Tax=Pinctada imbricata TaxID=66713 RepID=A0AA89BSN7_PINIB|nr:hypothetical protein FSP39_007832 [Pinctada imbricata]
MRRKGDIQHRNIKHKRLHINQRDPWATGADLGSPATQVTNDVVIRIAFSPCFLIYLMCVLPSLWLLEMDRFDLFDNILKNSNVSQTSDELSEIEGITLPIKLDNDTWVQILEQSFLVLLIFGRWILPHGALTRDELSGVLLIYIGSGSDVMELLIIFEEPEIHDDHALTLAFFAVWTLSLMQFTIMLPPNEKKEKPRPDESERDEEIQNQNGCCGCVDKCHCELLGLIIYTVLMDVPFLIVRMIALVKHRLLAYGIIFFALKNFMVILITIYRVVIIIHNKCKRKDKPVRKQQICVEEKIAKPTNSEKRDERKELDGMLVPHSNRNTENKETQTSNTQKFAVQNGITSNSNLKEADTKKTEESPVDTHKEKMHKEDTKKSLILKANVSEIKILKNTIVAESERDENKVVSKSDMNKSGHIANEDKKANSKIEGIKTMKHKEGTTLTTSNTVKNNIIVKTNKDNLANATYRENDTKKDGISVEKTKSTIDQNNIIPQKIEKSRTADQKSENKEGSRDAENIQSASQQRNANEHNVDTQNATNQKGDINTTVLCDMDLNQTTSNGPNQKHDPQIRDISNRENREESHKNIQNESTLKSVSSDTITGKNIVLSVESQKTIFTFEDSKSERQGITNVPNIGKQSNSQGNDSNAKGNNKKEIIPAVDQKGTTNNVNSLSGVIKPTPVSYYKDQKGNLIRPASKTSGILPNDNKQTSVSKTGNTQNGLKDESFSQKNVTPDTKNADMKKSSPVSFYKDEKGRLVRPLSRSKSSLSNKITQKDTSQNGKNQTITAQDTASQTDVENIEIEKSSSVPLPKDTNGHIRPPSRARSFLTRSNRVADANVTNSSPSE